MSTSFKKSVQLQPFVKSNKCNKFESICRSSYRRCSIEKHILKNFAKWEGKHLCQDLFFNKVAGLRLQCLRLGI